MEMKRILLSSLIFLILATGLFAGENFSVTFYANFFTPNDSGYKDIYGSAKFLPEIKLRAKLFKNFYLWSGVGYLKTTGETSPELREESRSTQIFPALGAGINANINSKLGLRLEVGVLAVRYKEEALGSTVSDTALGFSLDGGLEFNITAGFFVDFSAGYLSASDEIEGTSIKLGGLKAGLGIGFGF